MALASTNWLCSLNGHAWYCGHATSTQAGTTHTVLILVPCAFCPIDLLKEVSSLGIMAMQSLDVDAFGDKGILGNVDVVGVYAYILM